MQITLEPLEFLNIIGGLPFVDENFEPKKLLTIVACLRRNFNKGSFDDALEKYIIPEAAYLIYKRNGLNPPSFPESTSLTENESMLIDEAISSISSLCPRWRDLYSIPIKYYKLKTKEISLTNPLIPQFMFLGMQAFQSKILLQEILVHEGSHIWSSMIAEICDFQKKETPSHFVLPSGTGNKDLRGVLLASLFAAAAVNYYRRLHEKFPDPNYSERILDLHNYLVQSLILIRNSNYATTIGRIIIERLFKFTQVI